MSVHDRNQAMECLDAIALHAFLLCPHSQNHLQAGPCSTLSPPITLTRFIYIVTYIWCLCPVVHHPTEAVILNRRFSPVKTISSFPPSGTQAGLFPPVHYMGGSSPSCLIKSPQSCFSFPWHACSNSFVHFVTGVL